MRLAGGSRKKLKKSGITEQNPELMANKCRFPNRGATRILYYNPNTECL